MPSEQYRAFVQDMEKKVKSYGRWKTSLAQEGRGLDEAFAGLRKEYDEVFIGPYQMQIGANFLEHIEGARLRVTRFGHEFALEFAYPMDVADYKYVFEAMWFGTHFHPVFVNYVSVSHPYWVWWCEACGSSVLTNFSQLRLRMCIDCGNVNYGYEGDEELTQRVLSGIKERVGVLILE